MNFWEDPHIFADLLNGCFSGGRKSARRSFCPWTRRAPKAGAESRKRIRDTKKLFYRHRPAAVLAVENQENPDCRMPVRCMRYDADEYERQIKAIAAVHKRKTGLSRFGEEDHLIPVLRSSCIMALTDGIIRTGCIDLLEFRAPPNGCWIWCRITH